VRDVCKECNNGWMAHTLETPVIPILTPMIRSTGFRFLSPADQKLLSTWAYKTALMTDRVYLTPILPLEYFRDFYEYRTPPHNAIIDLAGYGGSPTWNQHKGVLDRASTASCLTCTFTFNIWHVLFRVSIWEVELLTTPGGPKPAGPAGTTRIYPSDNPTVAWPSVVFPDIRAFDTFAGETDVPWKVGRIPPRTVTQDARRLFGEPGDA